MTNDFGVDFADELTEYFTSGTDITAPPSTAYVTLYDDTGTEVHDDLPNGRVGVDIGGGWDKTNTAFENADEINFGEALEDITVEEFAIKDEDADDDTALTYFQAAITDAPQDFATDTRVFFAPGELSVDILD